MRRHRHGLRRRYGHASMAANKARWDKLRADYLQAANAVRDQDIALHVKYGPGYQKHWGSAGENNRLEKARARRDRIGDKIYAMVLALSPRGEAWNTGAPAYWIREKLSWEDMIRPANEPMSVEVPAPFGATHGLK